MAEKKFNTSYEEEEEKKKKKRLLVIFWWVFGAAAIVGAGIGMYYAFRPKTKEYKVSCETNGVTLNNSKAIVGQEFNAEIGISQQMLGEGYILPEALTKVTSGDLELMPVENYSYNLQEGSLKADFKIPAEFVKGDITIDLKLVEPTEYEVSCDVDGVTLSETSAFERVEFITEISLADEKISGGYTLPGELTEVKCGESDITNYTYDLKDDNTKADFTIPGESIKGNISIDFEIVAPEEYEVSCNVDGVTLTDTTALKKVEFKTEIGIDDLAVIDGCTLPAALTEVKCGDSVLTDYTYNLKNNNTKADFTIPAAEVLGDISIDLELVEPEYKWYTDEEYIQGLDADDIGEIKILKVNGIRHQVRLIGVDEDVNSNGDTLHTTWEFANLISDSDGYSLTTQWNDSESSSAIHYNYGTSTLHHALNGTSVSDVLWSQTVSGTTGIWSSKYKCSVSDMLETDNPGIMTAIKPASKLVNINSSGWKEQSVNDKLFLLTPFEMGFSDRESREEATTKTYSFYSNADNIKRVKKQVKGRVGARRGEFSISSTAGQKYKYAVTSSAGYNPDNETDGGIFWTRSPVADSFGAAFRINKNGSRNSAYDVCCAQAYGVAPAFCL